MLKKTITFLTAILLLATFGFSQESFQQDSIDYANPKKYEIGGITVSGVKYLNQNVLIMLSGLSVGQKVQIPGDDISQAIKKLWKQGLFGDVKISASKIQNEFVFLNIELQEKPRLSKYSIKGLRKGEVESIREKINIMRGNIVSENNLMSIERKIKSHFAEKGFLNTQVEFNQQTDTSQVNNIILQIVVDKNKKVKIKDIHIVNNKKLSDDALKSAMKETKERGSFRPLSSLDEFIWGSVKSIFALKPQQIIDEAKTMVKKDYGVRIFKGSKFIESNYRDDKVALIKKYNKYGYRDAKIIEDTVIYNPDNTLSINIKVDEGDRYYFRNINWVGNTKYETKLLNSILKIKKGDVYNLERLETNIQYNPLGEDVSSLYMDNGYLFSSITPVEVNVENDSIDIEMRVYEGKQARINKVTLKGNITTNDHVAIREIRTRPGQLFSREKIIRSSRELAHLRFFNQEKLNPVPKPNPADGTVDIEYQVEETNSDQIQLSGGFGSNFFVGTLGFTFNNFSARNLFNWKAYKPIPSGDGQQLNIQAQSYGKGFFMYSASFVEPWLGGKKPNALSLSYLHSKYSPGSDRKFIRNAFTIGLGKRLKKPDDWFQLSQSVSFAKYVTKNYVDLIPVGDGDGEFFKLSYNVVFSRPSVDAIIFPRTGSDISVSLDLTPPYSLINGRDYVNMSDHEKYKWVEYHKWAFKGSFYKPLLGDLILSFRTKFGFLGHYNSDIGTTYFERYHLGGSGMQGYNFNSSEIIGMRGYKEDGLTPGFNTNIGGTIYNKHTLELRYPLSLNPSATIFVLGFLETGNAWDNFKSYKPFELYRSAGIGLRVFLPMFGLIGLDWGYGFDNIPGRPDYNKSQIHVSFGQSID